MNLTKLVVPFVVAASLAAQEATSARPLPRLVVMVSVDQLASWVLESALPHLGPHGFRRLMLEGTWFRDCTYAHACSETGPGHATLSTGAPASLHGIVKNQWFDPATGKKVYCSDDPEALALDDIPEGAGKGAAQLRAPTVAELVKAHHGSAAKVVAVSWKDRGAILMGGPGADLAVWFDAATGLPVTNRNYVDKTPEWLARLRAARPLDARFGWKWERIGPEAAYAGLVDDQPWETPHANGLGQRTLPQVVNGGKTAPSPEFYGQAYLSPLCSMAVHELALAALEGEQLGRDAVPDLFCISYSGVDYVGHAFGPESVEARDNLLRQDQLVADLLLKLDEVVGVGNYVVLLSADHGVGPTPDFVVKSGGRGGRGPLLLRARAAAEQALTERYGARPEGAGRYIVQASELSLYIDRAALPVQPGEDAEQVAAEAARIAARGAERAPNVMHAFPVAELMRQGPGEAPMQRAVYHALHPGRAGDVMVVFDPYWFDGSLTATHGSAHPYDREVPLFAMGPAVERGREDQQPVTPGLMAVLAARLLRVPVPSCATDRVPEHVFGPGR
ncbi:MAG: hypothetical protein RL148_1115 [Planctomycetota bacterium]|jgi:hypothetical protein